MKIAFTKVRNLDFPFDIVNDTFTFKGALSYKKRNLITLKAELTVNVDRICDRCGEEVKTSHKEDLNLLISDGIYSDSSDELDVIESFDGFVDLDEIANSEISLLNSDYCYCQSCQS